MLCTTERDVAETIGYARRTAAALAVRGGGHCFAGRSSTTGILIDLSELRDVSAAAGVATVGAGALLGDIYEQLGLHGLTIAAGACPSVGIAGLTLGGGLGILGRTHGLTSDQLVGARVVLADGRIVDCDEQREPALFWGLRGAGGGQFGIVTSFHFATVAARDVTCFELGWPYAHAAAAVESWQAWAPEAADELAASLLVTATDDLADPKVTLFGAMIGSRSQTVDALDELARRLASDPVSATIEELPLHAARAYLAAHAPGVERLDAATAAESRQAAVMFAKSEFFRSPLPPDAISALVDCLAAGRRRGETRELDFTPWGGAYNRVRANATAFAHRNERFLLKHAVVLDRNATEEERETARAWLARTSSIARPHGSGGVYPGFPDPCLAHWERAYHGLNYERLTRVKAQYDPDNVFRFHQSVPPRR